MANKKDQDKSISDRLYSIIEDLLSDNYNKHCVDCDAKGPRWASWNIGVFLCIRCAGIHRKLGVHISRVKSVNLDRWEVYQLAMMRTMGNCRARAVYEANLPENFKRPQSDVELEKFIRAKYEQKRYILPGYVPEKPDIDSVLNDIEHLEQARKKPRDPINKISITPISRPTASVKSANRPTPRSQSNASGPDLLDFNTTPVVSKPTKQPVNLFSQFDGATSDVKQEITSHNVPDSTISADLLGLHFGDSTGSMTVPSTKSPLHGSHLAPGRLDSTDQKTSKEAILALYQQPHVGANSGFYNHFTSSTGSAGPQLVTGNHWNYGPISSSFNDFSRASEPFQPSTLMPPPVSCTMPNAPPTASSSHHPQQTLSLFQNFPVWSAPSALDRSQFGHIGPQFPLGVNYGDSFSKPTHSQAEFGATQQMGSVVSTTNSFYSGPLHPTTDPQQAYLSRIQSQLAAFNLNNTNCPQ